MSLEIDGHRHEGKYRVMTGTVIVYFDGDIKFASHGNDRPEVVARWLLKDLCLKHGKNSSNARKEKARNRTG
ncbi:hypothetical protein [Paraburkholderia nodosa]|uniref:hypothetical protein n=1 Tax=Paraburkholderia nodosa TaxID=392320 RepID=UPI001FE00B29|nr:hypothetical protein [Paraburkholderia nodosa]